MMKKWKKRIALPVITVAALMITVPVYADNSGYVIDDAELLSDAQTESLAEKTQNLRSETGWDIFVVSTDDAEGKSATEYADDYFDTNAAVEDGVVLLIDMDNREITISTAGKSIYYLTDERIDNILDNAYAYVSEAQYSDCYEAMLDGVQQYYEEGIPSDAYIYDEETGKIIPYRVLTFGEILFAIGAALIVGAAVYFGINAKYRLKFAKTTDDHHGTGNVRIEGSNDRFVNQVVTHRRIPKDTGNGGGGGSNPGRSTVHTSSAGTSHGGGSRKF